MISFLKKIFCSHEFETYSTTDFTKYKPVYDAKHEHLKCKKCGSTKNIFYGDFVPPIHRNAVYLGQVPERRCECVSGCEDPKMPGCKISARTAFEVHKKPRTSPLDNKLLDNKLWDYLSNYSLSEYPIKISDDVLRSNIIDKEDLRMPSQEPESTLVDLIGIFDSLENYDVVIYSTDGKQISKTVKVKAFNRTDAYQSALRGNPNFRVIDVYPSKL